MIQLQVIYQTKKNNTHFNFYNNNVNIYYNMIITSYSNIDLIQGVIGYGNATEGITDWRLENTGAGVFNIHNSSSIITPSGGTTEIGQITNSTDRYMIFKGGTSTFTVPTGGIVCDILLVGGGGGGGNLGGGGGGGDVIYQTNISLPIGTYNIVVGAGGTGNTGYRVSGNNGNNSSISGTGITTITAAGGGGGGGYNQSPPAVPSIGISSGGGGGSGTQFSTGASSTYSGAGGNGDTVTYTPAGGGGGSVGAGVSPTIKSKAGDGGIGNDISIIGTSQQYGGGGGGMNWAGEFNYTAPNIGGGVGVYGGGNGSYTNNGSLVEGTVGTPNTGGGGGGGQNTTGRSGGSGIVIIRYSIANISIIDNGNVGIGTAPITSSSKLEIYGDINISGNYRLNNRDVINDTSNYILTTSNTLVPRIITEVGHGSNYVGRIATQINTTIDNTSNYVAITCNLLANRVSSQWTNVSTGIHFTPATSSLVITSSPIATTVGTTGDYTYMSFTYTTETAGAGTGQTQYNITVPTGGVVCDILMVGGGGGGGSRHAGGGGAGAVVYLTNQILSTGAYIVLVGNGGTGATTMGQGNKGVDSSISFNSTAIYLAKGGGAGHHDASTGNSNKDGGSGGGSGGSTVGLAVSTNIPTGIYGNPGGFLTSSGGGGGGGALTSGSNGTNSTGGSGGNGKTITITGSSIAYGGGGGGGGGYLGAAAGTGGIGGGGPGSSGTATATNGTDGRGGGGGGGGFWDTSNGAGGRGGSGIIIIRFLTSTRNVGIGTTNPTSELHVYDDTITNTKLTVQNNYVDPIVISPNTFGYTAVETLESNKFYRTITFNYFPNYPEDPPNTSLLAWYRLNGDGLDYNPYSTKYNLIANSGTPTYSSGTTTDSFLQGRRYINTSAGSLRSTTLSLASRAFSIALWLRPKSTSDTVFIGQTASIGVNISLHIGWRENNAHFLGFYGNDINCGTGVSGNPTTYPGDANTWVHMVYVVLPNYNRRVYRNGVLISTDSNTTAFSGSGDLKIGANYGTNASQNVDFSDLRIYSNGLSATEVATLYASYTNLVITDNYSVNFKSSTTLLVNSVSKTVNGAYTVSMGHINSSMLPAGGQSDTPLASTALTSLPIKYEYSNTSYSLPALITVSGATSSIIGTTERAISFTYTSDSLGLTGQTQYSFTPTEDIWCDILVVGGGGGGGRFGGGGGGGGVLLATNLKLSGGISVIVKVGDGGTGATTVNSGVNGVNGYNSSIIINSIEYIALGGGGGGTRFNSPFNGNNGSNGGSGGGGSSGDNVQGLGGISNKNNYANFQSFGNNGGNGNLSSTPQPAMWISGGGGGAGSIGSDFSRITGGGNGGRGKDFISYFGTNVGHMGWFAGGGGGNVYFDIGIRGYGNGGLGLYGGGGNSGYDGTLPYFADNGLINTGGGGGGGNHNNYTISSAGGKGGSGFVIIRYRKIITQSASLELITPLSISEPQTQPFNVESIYPPYRYFTYNDTNGVYTVQYGSIEAGNSTNFSYTYSYNDPANTQGNNEQTSSTFKYTHGMGLYTFSVGGTQTAGGRSSGIFIYGLTGDYGSATNGNRPGVNFDDNAALPDGSGWYVGTGWTNATTYNSSYYYNSSFAGAWIKIEIPINHHQKQLSHSQPSNNF